MSVVLVGLFQFNQHNRQLSKKNKYQLLYTYTKNKLCMKLVFLYTLFRDARSTKHKIYL